MVDRINAEADALVRGLKPYKLESAIERLKKVEAPHGSVFFASPNGTVRSFLPTRMIATKHVAQWALDSGVGR